MLVHTLTVLLCFSLALTHPPTWLNTQDGAHAAHHLKHPNTFHMPMFSGAESNVSLKLSNSTLHIHEASHSNSTVHLNQEMYSNSSVLLDLASNSNSTVHIHSTHHTNTSLTVLSQQNHPRNTSVNLHLHSKSNANSSFHIFEQTASISSIHLHAGQNSSQVLHLHPAHNSNTTIQIELSEAQNGAKSSPHNRTVIHVHANCTSLCNSHQLQRNSSVTIREAPHGNSTIFVHTLQDSKKSNSRHSNVTIFLEQANNSNSEIVMLNAAPHNGSLIVLRSAQNSSAVLRMEAHHRNTSASLRVDFAPGHNSTTHILANTNSTVYFKSNPGPENATSAVHFHATGVNNTLHLSSVSGNHSRISFHIHETNQSQSFVNFTHLAKGHVNSSSVVLNVHPTQNSTTNVQFNLPAGANLNGTSFLVRDVNETVAIRVGGPFPVQNSSMFATLGGMNSTLAVRINLVKLV
ncbi:hypothetical protein Ddc_16384 [Ditylenchus destructor]|nr:hypothetical protein Ddc_16384 [Ditylenchus destructor]